MINLDQLRDLLGDETLLVKYIDLFKISGPKNIQEIKDAFSKKDTESLVIATHSLKTQFAYLGHTEALELTAYLENVKQQQIDNEDITIINAINSLSSILDKVLRELNIYIST